MFSNRYWILHGSWKNLFATFQLYSDNLPEEDYQSMIEMLQIKFYQLPSSVQYLLPKIVYVSNMTLEVELTNWEDTY